MNKRTILVGASSIIIILAVIFLWQGVFIHNQTFNDNSGTASTDVLPVYLPIPPGPIEDPVEVHTVYLPTNAKVQEEHRSYLPIPPGPVIERPVETPSNDLPKISEQNINEEVRSIKEKKREGNDPVTDEDVWAEVLDLKKHVLAVGGVSEENLVTSTTNDKEVFDAEDTDGETQEYTPHGSGSRSKKDKNDSKYVAPLPTPLPIPQFTFNTNWNSSAITSLTMPDGTTGLPSAQAEVYFGQIPGTNEGIILQTVFMQSNNKAYNRWAKVNLSTGTTIWGNFAAPVDLSAFAIPSVPANGTVNAYGLTLIPSGNKLLTTIFVNNVGYSRTADYEIKSDGTVYISGSSSWQQFMLPGLVSGTVQAYDYAYYSHDGGFYLETVAKNNSFYYRYIKPEGSVVSTVQNRSSATNWQQPILGSTIPGEGNIITYSYYVINEGNFLSQAIWKTSGGVFRTIRANQLQYPQEQYYAEYDYNNDGKTNLQDLIIMLQALFNP